MRKRIFKKWVSAILSLAMVVSMAGGVPAAAVTPGVSVSISDSSLSLQQTAEGDLQYSTDGGGDWTTYTGTITVTGSTTENTVTVESGAHNITLNGVSIDVSSESGINAFFIDSGAAVSLTLKGENKLIGSKIDGYDTEGCSAMRVKESTLTVTSASSGSLTATSTGMYTSGISDGTGTINIEGGTVNASSTSGYGIYGNTVTIRRGTVTATGGIKSKTVSITGGTVKAASKYEKDISGSCYISGGSVNANSMSVPPAVSSTDSTAVYLTSITLDGVSAVTPVTDLGTAASYGTADLNTDASGNLYLWLPADTVTTGVKTADGTYTGSVTTTADGTASATFSKPGNSVYFADGDGSSTNPYQIATADQLKLLASVINGGAAATVISGGTEQAYTDLQWANYKLAADIELNDTTGWESWNASTSSLNTWTPIGTSTYSFSGTFDGDGHTVSGLYISNTSDCQGLFGVSGGTVENVGVVDSYLSGGNSVGGLVGKNYGGTVQTCYNTGVVSGVENVGGVVGYNKNATVKSSYNAGTVSGTNKVGGVVGNDEGGTTEYSYNTGVVSGSSYVGGVIGVFYMGIIKQCYFDSTVCTVGGINGTDSTDMAEGKSTAEMQTATPFTDWDTDTVWTFEAGKYPQLKAIASSDSGDEDGGTSDVWDGSTADTDWYNDTETSFTITTAADLAGLAQLVNDGNNFSDKTITLGNDIALNDITGASDWDDTTTGLNSWTPIGTYTSITDNKLFSGTFDGDGHTVSGLYISNTSDYQGLFGVSGGTVENIGVVDSYLSGGNLVGGLVGDNYGGTVKNVGVTKSCIKGNQYVGGVAGNNFGTVSSCYNSGAVSGSDSGNSVGGVAGENNRTIKNCYNTGTISGSLKVGGVVGGVMGSTTVSNCYNTGSVSGTSVVGGVAGYNGGTVTDCYYDKTIDSKVGGAINGADATEATGKTTDEMQVAAPYTDNWSTDVWLFTEGKYPQLKGIASSSSACDVSSVITPSDAKISGDIITASVDNSTNSVTAGLTVSDKASWKLYSDSSCTKEITGNNMSLSVGENTAYVKVTAEDGTTKKTYTLTVTRAALITNFKELEDEEKSQKVAYGTLLQDVVAKLPATLSVTVDDLPDVPMVKVKNWVCLNPTTGYNPIVPGNYTFTPVLEDNFDLDDGVSVPPITVTVESSSSSNPSSKSDSTSDSTSSTASKPHTETKIATDGHTSTVTTVADSVTQAGDTATITLSVPSITSDTTGAGTTLDTTQQANVQIDLPTDTIKQQLAAKKNVDLTLAVPHDVATDSNGNVSLNINAAKEIFEEAKNTQQDVTLKVQDMDTKEIAYTWVFKGEDLAKSSVPVTDVNIAMSLHLTTEVEKVQKVTPNETGLVISFDHSGALPSTANVKFSAQEKGFKPGDTMYFYYYNPTTGQVDPLGKQYTVDAFGFVEVQINHCSDYVLLKDALRSITLDTRTYTMKPGDSYVTGVTLTNAPGTVIKAYSSTKGVVNVTVLSNGNVKAVGLKPGQTYVMIDVYDSKNKKLTHASVRLTVEKGVKASGNSYRQYGIF